MSDGPYRSLPLKRHWKKFLERVVTPSYSPDEVTETLYHAILNDLRDSPMAQVINILLGEGQQPLFHENHADQFESLRRNYPGSAASNILLDCATEANADGFTGERAVSVTMENTFETLFHSNRISIEEHCKRKESWKKMNIRTHLKAAWKNIQYSKLLAAIMPNKSTVTKATRLTKHTGLDKGPLI